MLLWIIDYKLYDGINDFYGQKRPSFEKVLIFYTDWINVAPNLWIDEEKVQKLVKVSWLFFDTWA